MCNLLQRSVSTVLWKEAQHFCTLSLVARCVCVSPVAVQLKKEKDVRMCGSLPCCSGPGCFPASRILKQYSVLYTPTPVTSEWQAACAYYCIPGTTEHLKMTIYQLQYHRSREHVASQPSERASPSIYRPLDSRTNRIRHANSRRTNCGHRSSSSPRLSIFAAVSYPNVFFTADGINSVQTLGPLTHRY